jgi:hypothetical protein
MLLCRETESSGSGEHCSLPLHQTILSLHFVRLQYGHNEVGDSVGGQFSDLEYVLWIQFFWWKNSVFLIS